MAISTYLQIIILNINGQNAPIKGHKVAHWIKKKKNYLHAAVRHSSESYRYTDWK